MSGTNAQQHSAMRVAEWKAEAKLTGRTFAQVACGAMRSAMQGREKPAAQAWREISIETRSVILAMTVERKTRQGIQWDELTQDEQIAAGAFARRLARELGPTAGRLR